MNKLSILPLVGIVSFYTSVQAQDFKVKKDILSINGKEVAKITKQDRQYHFSDLATNELVFKAYFMDTTPNNNVHNTNWLVLVGANGVTKEVEQPDTKFTLSMEKWIINSLLASDTKLLTGEGLNKEKIATFFDKDDFSISTKIDETIAQQKETIAKEEELAKTNKLYHNSKGEIFANDNKIGYIFKSATQTSMGNEVKYTVADIGKRKVAEIKFNDAFSIYRNQEMMVKTYDGKGSALFMTKYDADITKDGVATRMIQRLYANGYQLGDMQNAIEGYVNDQNTTATNEAKMKSINIYDANGYVLDNGNKLEGKITIEFESLNELMGREKGMADITNYGGSVTLDIDGKKQYFQAKKGTKFCIGDRCFIGTRGSEDGNLGNTSGSQLSVLGESQFFEIDFEDGEHYVLHHIKNPQYYYLKLKNNDKAVYLGDVGFLSKRSNDKIKKIFDKYVNCPSLDFSKYDTLSKEGLIQIIKDYKQACEK